MCVVFEKARTVFSRFLAISKICVIVFVGLSFGLVVSEPSHRIMLFCEVHEISILIQVSSRLPNFIGMLIKLE